MNETTYGCGQNPASNIRETTPPVERTLKERTFDLTLELTGEQLEQLRAILGATLGGLPVVRLIRQLDRAANAVGIERTYQLSPSTALRDLEFKPASWYLK